MLATIFSSVSASADSAAWAFTGDLVFTQAELTGETFAAVGIRAAILDAKSELRSSSLPDPDQQESFDLSLAAGEAILNWTRVVRRTFEANPAQPGGPPAYQHNFPAASDEETLRHAELRGQAWGREPGLLIVVPPGAVAHARLETSSALSIGRADSGSWTTGDTSNRTVATDEYDPLSETYRFQAPQTVVKAREVERFVVTGDFDLYLWSVNVTAATSDGEAEFQSGKWQSNATKTPVDGLTQEVQVQFLRLHLRDAQFEWRGRTATIETTVEEGVVQTSGAVYFKEVWGDLSTSDALFEIRAEPLYLVGSTGIYLEPGLGETRGVAARLGATAAPMFRSPDLLLRGPTHAPGFGLSWPAWGWFVGSPLIGGGAYLGFRRLRSSRDWDGQLAAAREALDQDRLNDAISQTRRLVKRRPSDGQAWFFHCVARVAAEGPLAVAGEVERVWDTLSQKAGIALILATGFMQQGDDAACRKWYTMAQRDPEFGAYLRNDPGLRVLRDWLHRSIRPDYSYG